MFWSFRFFKSVSIVFVFVALILIPGFAWCCACGCGLFDVGTGAMYPTSTGGIVSLQYDYMDQNQNWNLDQPAPASANSDKEIQTSFLTAGGKYMFSRSWGMQVQVPVWIRYFRTTDPSSNIVSSSHTALGDIRISGVYTGLSEDMSTGLTFGLKLATGDSTYPNFDADTEIGTGSTDLLVGEYHLGKIGDSGIWDWFVQMNADLPVAAKLSYTPGNEFDAALGGYYDGFSSNPANKIAALLSLLGAVRAPDNGSAADAGNSGYRRALVAPGAEWTIGKAKIYGDVELPVYQYYNGNQLAASVLYKLATSYRF